MQPATELCTYCTDLTFERLPDDVQRLSKQYTLDTLGIGIRGLETDSGQVVYDSANEALSGPPESTVWSTGKRESASFAAFVNGSLVHMLELDDTHREAVIHPGAPIVAAAMAIGEREDVDGQSFLTAMVAGYEVACRLGMALRNHRVHLDRGFHGTATCGVFGGAVAGGLLAGFDAEELENLLGIVLSQASGSLQYKENGAWTKRIHPGLAARDAVLAVSLGKHGFRGAADPLTGTYGLLNMYGVDPQPDRLTSGLGSDFEIRRTGIKPYACCRYNHPAVDATLDLVTEHDIHPDDVEEITVSTFESAFALSNPRDRKIKPQTVVDAQFSPQYAVGVAVVDRAVLPDQFTRARLTDPALRGLLERIVVEEDPSMTDRFPAAWPTSVRIETADESLTATVEGPRGEPERRLTVEAIVEKFRSVTSPATTDAATDTIIEHVLSLESHGLETLGDTIAAAVETDR